jgi:hypothetical protein
VGRVSSGPLGNLAQPAWAVDAGEDQGARHPRFGAGVFAHPRWAPRDDGDIGASRAIESLPLVPSYTRPPELERLVDATLDRGDLGVLGATGSDLVLLRVGREGEPRRKVARLPRALPSDLRLTRGHEDGASPRGSTPSAATEAPILGPSRRSCSKTIDRDRRGPTSRASTAPPSRAPSIAYESIGFSTHLGRRTERMVAGGPFAYSGAHA